MTAPWLFLICALLLIASKVACTSGTLSITINDRAFDSHLPMMLPLVKTLFANIKAGDGMRSPRKQLQERIDISSIFFDHQSILQQILQTPPPPQQQPPQKDTRRPGKKRLKNRGVIRGNYSACLLLETFAGGLGDASALASFLFGAVDHWRFHVQLVHQDMLADQCANLKSIHEQLKAAGSNEAKAKCSLFDCQFLAFLEVMQRAEQFVFAGEEEAGGDGNQQSMMDKVAMQPNKLTD